MRPQIQEIEWAGQLCGFVRLIDRKLDQVCSAQIELLEDFGQFAFDRIKAVNGE